MGLETLQGKIDKVKKDEGYLRIQHALLELFAKRYSRKEYLDEIVELLCRWTGCRCGGIRVLDEYGNIPYASYLGFSREFWGSENHLSIHKNQCACIRVMSEKPEPLDSRVLTPGGSFFCNNTLRFIDGLSEEEKERFRGACVRNGFVSVAIIPIRYRDEVLGAIHLADEREEKVPRPMVEFIESFTALIGEAVHRFNLEEEIQRNYETQKLINSFMGFSLEDISLEELLRRGLELILSIPWLSLESKGAIFLIEGDPEVLVLRAQTGLPESIRQTCGRVPLGHCICGRAAQGSEIYFVGDSAQGQEENPTDMAPHGHYCIPLVSAEGFLGLVNLYVPEGYRDDERKREFLKTIARVFVSSIQHKRAEGTIQESEKQLRALSVQLLNAQEKERKRIAQELHDGIGQNLAAIKFGVENILHQMGGKRSDPPIKTLDTTVKLIQNAVEEVRRIATDLRPSMLDDLGILATLGWFIREFETIYSGIRIESSIEIQERDVPDPLKIVIYRVLQEGLNNVAKHSRTECVSVSLKRTGNAIELAIKDEGIGFDLENARAGLGLASMRERVELPGGMFSLESVKGKGTVIRAIWPSSWE